MSYRNGHHQYVVHARQNFSEDTSTFLRELVYRASFQGCRVVVRQLKLSESFIETLERAM